MDFPRIPFCIFKCILVFLPLTECFKFRRLNREIKDLIDSHLKKKKLTVITYTDKVGSAPLRRVYNFDAYNIVAMQDKIKNESYRTIVDSTYRQDDVVLVTLKNEVISNLKEFVNLFGDTHKILINARSRNLLTEKEVMVNRTNNEICTGENIAKLRNRNCYYYSSCFY